jgi:DNA-binding transcriptional ArsR family regulator
MEFEREFTHIAQLLGDKARSLILWALLDGKAYTATELAAIANISRQSASNHLSKLTDSQMLIVEKQGRHRYFRLANNEIAEIIESIASLIPENQIKPKNILPNSNTLFYARTCYDHLAGKLAIKITDSLIRQGILIATNKEFLLTQKGDKWFKQLGIDIDKLKLKKRTFARKCLDWTERRHHIAGSLGYALLNFMLQNDWLRKKQFSREVYLTSKGKQALYSLLKIEE